MIQQCLSMLRDAQLTRLEKLRLEVEIRRAKHALNGSHLTEDEANDLVLKIYNRVVSRCGVSP